MTDKKKQPENDEVGDEQLEDVAGGITAAQSPIPIPYPNLGSDIDGATKKVKVDGKPAETKG